MTSRSKQQEAKHHASLISDAKLRQLYSAMLQSRMFDERARLLMANRFPGLESITTPAPETVLTEDGVEATAVGCTISLRSHDAVSSIPHAQLGQSLPHVRLSQSLAKLYRQGKLAASSPANGAGVGACNGARGSSSRSSLNDVLRLADQLKKTGNVVVTFLYPEIHPANERQEAFAIAVENALPILFVAHESGRAKALESGRAPGRSHLKNLKDRSLPGTCIPLPCIPVDKNDVIAVYRVAYESIQRARRRGGPTLIDCKAYRLENSKKENSKKGRNGSYGVEHAGDDPIDRMQRYLERKGLFDLAWKNKLTRHFREMLDGALK